MKHQLCVTDLWLSAQSDGKTTIMNILTDALGEEGQPHKLNRMNPKSITGQ